MAGIVRRLRENPSAVRRAAIADVLVALLVPGSAALAGLVLAEALPAKGGDPSYSMPRLAALAAGLVLLIAAVVWRRKVRRGSGTLFSVQLLDEEMEDRHQEATKRAARRHMSVRVLTRRFDLRARTSGGVVDLVDVVDDLGRDLASNLNQDRNDTGYSLAPNLLWPTAVALGNWLNRVEDIHFIDFKDQNDDVTFRLTDRQNQPVSIKTEEEPVFGGAPGRLGIWLAFTEMAAKLSIHDFVAFGASSVVTLRRAEGTPEGEFGGAEMCGLAAELATTLADLRRTTPAEREIVVVAMIPKTVGLLLGWHLSQEKVRFFAGTHLMYYDWQRTHEKQLNTPYLAMRVHPSQPRHFPAPANELFAAGE